jgi:predicted signal transduction protein with EAL and GGDEF domain
VDSVLVAEARAAELIAQVTDTKSVNRVAVSIGLTVGIALGAIGEAKTAALIREADIALYEAKRAGRNRARVFDDSMAAAAVRRRLIEHDLPEAMASGAIGVHFQPVVRASTREMIGVEALARWRHPLLGHISPLEFVGIAEETGQIRALGRHILRTALTASRSWSSLLVSVNLSPLEFRLPDLAEEILATLEEIDFPPARLEVEVTESLLLDDLEATRQQIVTLHDRGIRVALDDFGTGYSSLSYLRTIPFDKVKIDRSFVTDIGTDDTSAAIVECVANLARQLNIEVTAEGVETEDQEILLRAAGCGTFQGYRFGRPMPAADLDTRYRRQAEPTASIRLVAG